MIGDFHMEEYEPSFHHRGYVYWHLNLKADEELRHGDAFLHDHMLGYLDEGHE